MRCRVAAIASRGRAFGRLQLHDDTGKTLGERIVDITSHAIAFRYDCRLAALLRQAH